MKRQKINQLFVPTNGMARKFALFAIACAFAVVHASAAESGTGSEKVAATVGIAVSSGALRPAHSVSAVPVGLKCESAVSPFIDLREPRLSWRLDDPRNGAAQTAYRILAASSAEKLARNEGDLWDSGKVS
ncbi:MAG: hypothetical protein EPN23_10215, partial [Verrucomicrobia bacterium]